MKLNRYILYIGCIALLCALSACTQSNRHPVAKKGVLDLSALDLDKETPIKLDGEWEFYWKQLYTPADFATGAPAMTDYIEVPVFWNSQKIKGEKLPWNGYATYRLRLKKRVTSGFLAINIPDPNSAYKLWINGQPVAAEGRVGRTKAEEQPRLQPVAKIFRGDETELEIVLQVSNFFHHKAGVWQSMSFGTEHTILTQKDNSILLNMCLVGAFFILSIYNLFIYVLRKVEYSALIFSLLSLCFAIRTFVIDERPILFFFPGLTTDILHRIQYESIFAAMVFFTGFVYSLTHREFPRKLLNFIIWVSVAELLIICFAPVAFYTRLLLILQLKVIAEAGVCYYVIGKSIARKRKRAWLLFILLTINFIAAINDVLFTNCVIHTGYQIQNFCFLILLVQAYIVATRISGAYYKFSNLTIELNEANLGLERKVAVRTEELEKEKKKTDDLLLNILPLKAAQDMKTHGRSQAQVFKNATVMLIDMVGFTRVSEQISAELLVAEIDECFRAFDDIMGIYGIEKIKTIGDAYLCAGGLPEPNDTHAEDIINAAIRINEYMASRFREKELAAEVSFRIRTGIHSGPVVAGIVGIKKFSYDIWGDTVNITGEMEQLCHPGKINLSQATYELVKHRFACEHYGEIAIGAEAIKMYYLEQPVGDLV